MKAILITILMLVYIPVKLYAVEMDSTTKSHFYKAKEHIEDMLSGKAPLSYERAIYEIENAWYGGELSYELFDATIEQNLSIIKAIADSKNVTASFNSDLLKSATQKKHEYNKAVMNYAIYSYMTDTMYAIRRENLTYYVHQTPLSYSYADPLGTNSWINTQVTNLIETRQGNCFALASLYKIFSEKLQSEAKLCTAPGHIYIRHADEKGVFYNIELASRSFPGTGTIETVTYTSSEATTKGITLRELDLKQSVALCLIYLAKGYEYKFGKSDNEFILSCAETALKYDDYNLNAMLLKAEVLEDNLTASTKDIEILRKQKGFKEYQEWITHIFSLGYREMPYEMKNQIIKARTKDTITYLKTKEYTPSRTNDIRYAGLSWGLFDEEIRTKPIERLGNTAYDTKKKKIVAFLESDILYNQYNFDPVVFAWNVDPLAHKLPSWSPYAFCLNNPISMFDPDGAFPFTVHVRSFHPNQAFGKLTKNSPSFHGDNRGFTVSTAKDVTSRINHQFTFDVDKGSIAYNDKNTWSNPSYDDKGNTKTATPRGHVSKMNKSGDKASFYTSYSGNNPLVTASPDIDVFAKFNVQEDKKNHLLNINMKAKGDDFPNTEAFITDASGKSIFLGVDVRSQGKDNSPFILFGGYEEDIMESSMSVGLDNDGNFTNVSSGGKTYSLDEWNAKFQNTSAKPSDK